MSNRFLKIFVPTFLVGAFAFGAVGGASAGAIPGASFQVVPHRALIGKMTTVQGRHLPANKFFPLILAVGNPVRPHLQQFVGLGRSDKNGNLKWIFRMPIVPQCGPASILVTESGSKAMTRVTFVLGGCKAAKRPISPPPPPKKTKPKKTKKK